MLTIRYPLLCHPERSVAEPKDLRFSRGLAVIAVLTTPFQLHMRMGETEGFPSKPQIGYPGFPVESDFSGEVRAPLFTESRISGRRCRL
jgi:hypothetical protein